MFDEAGRPVEVLVDAPDGGNLADRGRRQSSATVADLLNGKHLLQYNDIRSFTSMNDDKLEILASAEYGAARHAFDDAAWANATDIVSHYYNLILADGGAGLLQPAARGVLSTVSAVVIVTGACVDGARLAAATLDWLRQNGYQHLLARACVVINHLIPGKPGVDMADLVVQFQRYVAPGRVVVLPWDKHVAAGTEIQLDLLSRRFRRGTVELAAALSDDFDRVEQHTPRDSRS
jgi:MinD-like ATPase involved in chromosome partitioning or flagellar assembly